MPLAFSDGMPKNAASALQISRPDKVRAT